MKKSITILLFFAFFLQTMAWSQCFKWKGLKSWGSTGAEFATHVTSDASGNIFITGEFRDSIDVGGIVLIEDDGNGSTAFLAKYDSDLNLLWALQSKVPTVDPFYCIPTGLEVDPSGNAVLVGNFESDTLIFGTDTLFSSNRDGYLIKADPSGNISWSLRLGGTSSDGPSGLDIDNNGNIFVTGYYTSSMTLGAFTLNSKGSRDVYVAKIDPNGNVMWAVSAGGTGIDRAGELTLDPTGNVFITSNFKGTMFFGADSLVNNTNQNDGYAAKLDGNGNWLWARAINGPGDDNGVSIEADSAGNLYVGGTFRDTVIAGAFTLVSQGAEDLFLLKYDLNGSEQWMVREGTNSSDGLSEIIIDGENRLWMDFDLGSYNLTQGNFLLKAFDLNGNSLANKMGGRVGGAEVMDFGLDPSGDLIVVGTTNFSPNPTTVFNLDTIENKGAQDMFFVRLHPFQIDADFTASTDTNLCSPDSALFVTAYSPDESYQWFWNGLPVPGAYDTLLFAANSGLYSLEITDNGCVDTSKTTLVTIHSIPTPLLTVTGNDLTCNPGGLNYTWYHDGNLLIGANAQTHTASLDGAYYVVLEDSNGCIGISDTVQLIVTGTEDLNFSNSIKLFPNPSGNTVNIEVANERKLTGMKIEVFDLNGRNLEIRRIEQNMNQLKLDLSDLSPGLYMIQFSSNNQQTTLKLFKQ